MIFVLVRRNNALRSVFAAEVWGTLLVRPSGAVLEEAVTRDRTSVTGTPHTGETVAASQW
jgi:hypothetical protein